MSSPVPAGGPTALTQMDVAGRIPRLRARLAAARCDAIIVTNLTNVRYLTGFTGSAATLLVGAERGLVVSDGRYATQAAQQLRATGIEGDIDIEIGNTPVQQDRLRAAAKGLGRIGLEAGSITWAQQRALTALLDDEELVPTESIVEQLRSVKDAGELARIEAACGIADAALAEVLPRLAELPTERDFGIELDFTMRRLGAADVSFETIVASGPNAAKPHARPTTRRVQPGEMVVIDFGALVDGYHSDMTRTVCLGEPSSAKAKELHAVVLEAQAAGVAAVAAGVSARDVDARCRESIASAGYGDAFVHGTGHGVGLDIHEFPILTTTATASLETGFVVTVEPGVYVPGEGGVRIEDSVVVTADGCRRLTNAPKDLVID